MPGAVPAAILVRAGYQAAGWWSIAFSAPALMAARRTGEVTR
ncbi:hypothetical protein [Nonomuraea sediminis]|nr:hypothetical protein [Nonomuraea sediminis]